MRLVASLIPLALTLCACSEAASCGPSDGFVSRVIDGDTLELASGERVRYLLVDTPELGPPAECHAVLALAQNRALVERQRVRLRYDSPCEDRFGRLLAYVSVGQREVNTALVAEGYGCVLHVPPGGASRVTEFEAHERSARAAGLGLWSACSAPPCGR